MGFRKSQNNFQSRSVPRCVGQRAHTRLGGSAASALSHRAFSLVFSCFCLFSFLRHSAAMQSRVAFNLISFLISITGVLFSTVNHLFFIFMCMCVCLHACVCTQVCKPTEARRGHIIPWNWSNNHHVCSRKRTLVLCKSKQKTPLLTTKIIFLGHNKYFKRKLKPLPCLFLQSQENRCSYLCPVSTLFVCTILQITTVQS